MTKSDAHSQRDEGHSCAKDPRASLVGTIQGEILPRLMLAHREALVGRDANLEGLPPSADDIQELARLLVLDDPEPVRVFLDQIRGRGTSIETIYLDLLTPAARLLGEMWLDDRCSWVDVTVGLTRLHQVVRELARKFPGGSDHMQGTRGRVLLLLGPDEQHCLGICLVEEMLRRSGWDVSLDFAPVSKDFVAALGKEDFDVVGFSMSRDENIDALRQMIEEARAASRNPDIKVLVGGRTFNDNPDYVPYVRADLFAVDAAEVVALLEQHGRTPPSVQSD